MGITPCFDPTTGASGGAAAAAAGGAVAWILADYTDGSWTTADTAEWLKSVTKVGDAMDLQCNTRVSSADYNITSTGNFTAWRAYKLATYADGTPVLANDTFALHVSLNHKTPTASQECFASLGIAKDPTATTVVAIGLAGGLIGYQGPITPAISSVAPGGFASSVTAHATVKGGIASVECAGDYYGAVQHIALTSAGARYGNGSRPSNYGGIGASQLYICGTFGAYANNTAGVDGSGVRAEFRYAFVKLPTPVVT